MPTKNCRHLFYTTNCKPKKTRNQAQPVHKRRFRKENWRNVRLKFDDENLTGRGGMPLIFLHQSNMDLKGKLGRAIKMQRRKDAFRPAECSKFLIDSKLEGIERLYHLEAPRVDPVYQKEYGLSELPCGKTMGEYLKSFEENHIQSLDNLNCRYSDWIVRKSIKRAEKISSEKADKDNELETRTFERDEKGRIKVGLDFDSTCMAVYGKHEGSDRGRHPRKKDSAGFQPKFGFVAGLDLMLHQDLYPESQGLNSEYREFYEETVARLPRGTFLGFVRGDSALYSKKNIQMFEDNGPEFGVSASKTSHMWKAIDLLPEESWQEYEDENGNPVELAELYYKPATWPGPHRVYILSRRLKKTSHKDLWGRKYKIFAYLTNTKGSLWERYKFCVERCTVEKCIRESKLGFDWNHLPCGEFDANRAYLGHVQLAYNFMISFKLTALGGEAKRWSADTIRRRMLTVPGRFSLRNSEILHLPAWWPHRHHLRYANRQLMDFKN